MACTMCMRNQEPQSPTLGIHRVPGTGPKIHAHGQRTPRTLHNHSGVHHRRQGCCRCRDLACSL
ncbi:hypothetical protein C2E23DRAFT_817159 [Lenzites betulinus]|nr:hypothetical protein C2E23DRAFT_817159 [Lenzites betulinus]